MLAEFLLCLHDYRLPLNALELHYRPSAQNASEGLIKPVYLD